MNVSTSYPVPLIVPYPRWIFRSLFPFVHDGDPEFPCFTPVYQWTWTILDLGVSSGGVGGSVPTSVCLPSSLTVSSTGLHPLSFLPCGCERKDSRGCPLPPSSFPFSYLVLRVYFLGVLFTLSVREVYCRNRNRDLYRSVCVHVCGEDGFFFRLKHKNFIIGPSSHHIKFCVNIQTTI